MANRNIIYSIEQNGEKETHLYNGGQMYDLMQNLSAAQPYRELMAQGDRISPVQAAEMEQSGAALSVDFNFDEKSVHVFQSDVPEGQRTDDNIFSKTFDLNEMKDFVNQFSENMDRSPVAYDNNMIANEFMSSLERMPEKESPQPIIYSMEQNGEKETRLYEGGWMHGLMQPLLADQPYAVLGLQGGRISPEKAAYMEQNGAALSVDFNFDENKMHVFQSDVPEGQRTDDNIFSKTLNLSDVQQFVENPDKFAHGVEPDVLRTSNRAYLNTLDCMPTAGKESVYTIEQYGEKETYSCSNDNLADLMMNLSAEAPYQSLMNYGQRISPVQAAEIEQSNNLGFSADFNFDENEVHVFQSEAPEGMRTDDNVFSKTFGIDEMQQTVNDLYHDWARGGVSNKDFMTEMERMPDKYEQYAVEDAELDDIIGDLDDYETILDLDDDEPVLDSLDGFEDITPSDGNAPELDSLDGFEDITPSESTMEEALAEAYDDIGVDNSFDPYNCTMEETLENMKMQDFYHRVESRYTSMDGWGPLQDLGNDLKELKMYTENGNLDKYPPMSVYAGDPLRSTSTYRDVISDVTRSGEERMQTINDSLALRIDNARYYAMNGHYGADIQNEVKSMGGYGIDDNVFNEYLTRFSDIPDAETTKTAENNFGVDFSKGVEAPDVQQESSYYHPREGYYNTIGPEDEHGNIIDDGYSFDEKIDDADKKPTGRGHEFDHLFENDNTGDDFDYGV